MKFHFDILAPIYESIVKPKEPTQMMEQLKLQSGNRFIELGGGTGRLTQYFVPYFKETWLLDPSEAMLKQAKAKYPALKLSCKYANQTDFPDNYFDLAFIYDSLHHWQGQEDALRETLRILGPDGQLAIGEIHPKHRIGYYIVKIEQVFQMRSTFFEPRALISILEEVGFTVTKTGWLRKPTYFVIASK